MVYRGIDLELIEKVDSFNFKNFLWLNYNSPVGKGRGGFEWSNALIEFFQPIGLPDLNASDWYKVPPGKFSAIPGSLFRLRG